LINKLSDKDKKDWQNFLSSKKKVHDKDISNKKTVIDKKSIINIDLHGFSLEKANQVVEDIINECFYKNIYRINVITGKGLRSKNIANPYLSKDLSILRYSVPEFIKSNKNLMKMIKYIEEADNKEGGSGAFNIYLKKSKE
tara:strand:- start:472 stop:894 length:423 start_codon:yes stop_codon:yes gene_type:complete